MTALPTGPAGRWAALGLTLALLALAWFAVASPLIDWHAQRADRLDDRRLLERRMQAIAATLPALRRSEQASAAAGPARTTVLDGPTDAIAAATLQQRVQEMAAGAGATLTSVETLPAADVGAYRRIAVRLSLNAPWPELVRLLHSVDEASPRMLVDDLQLHAVRLAIQPTNSQLSAGLTVLAFRAGTGPSR